MACTTDAADAGALFSPCRTYRYALWRTWDERLPAVLFVGLNPSTADETADDPTVRRCRGFARDWGYGGFVLCNLFAYRATDPRALLRAEEPVGPENDRWLRHYSEQAGLIVAAWGVRGGWRGRDREVLGMREEWRCLGTGKAGFPRHPLYVRRDCVPASYLWGDAQARLIQEHMRLDNDGTI
jgi:hypothetical protein